ncbi:MAG: hypothetical protein WA823_08515 [Candidatus Acidiferrales bacterium]
MRKLDRGLWWAQAVWKGFTSRFKREWTLDDYPIRVRSTKPTDPASASRFKTIPWYVDVVNWSAISGQGDTKQEALENLRKSFDRFVATREPRPRPGTNVPIKFAVSVRVQAHAELARDFTNRILGLDWVWISDESSLWDFHAERTNEKYVEAIRRVYAVDVSDITNGNLADIFDRAQKQGASPPRPN